MPVVRGTYERLSKYFLREARSCLKSKAYRMSIVASATAVYMAGYFILLYLGKLDQKERIADFNAVFIELKKTAKLDTVVNDIEWLMNARNGLLHPEELLVPKINPVPGKNKGFYEISFEKKLNNVPSTKQIMFLTSQHDTLGDLKKYATEAISKAEKINLRLGFAIEKITVEEWKNITEQRIKEISGISVDLENETEIIDSRK